MLRRRRSIPAARREQSRSASATHSDQDFRRDARIRGTRGIDDGGAGRLRPQPRLEQQTVALGVTDLEAAAEEEQLDPPRPARPLHLARSMRSRSTTRRPVRRAWPSATTDPLEALHEHEERDRRQPQDAPRAGDHDTRRAAPRTRPRRSSPSVVRGRNTRPAAAPASVRSNHACPTASVSAGFVGGCRPSLSSAENLTGRQIRLRGAHVARELPKIISVDDHVVEPAAPLDRRGFRERFRDAGPKVERRGIGHDEAHRRRRVRADVRRVAGRRPTAGSTRTSSTSTSATSPRSASTATT